MNLCGVYMHLRSYCTVTYIFSLLAIFLLIISHLCEYIFNICVRNLKFYKWVYYDVHMNDFDNIMSIPHLVAPFFLFLSHLCQYSHIFVLQT